MNNNRKQKVYSILDSLTQTELDNYIKDKNIDLEKDKLINKLNELRKPKTHWEKAAQKINDDFGKVLNSYFNLGRAWIIAFVLQCFYDDKYKIADLKSYLYAIIKDNPELKEMVYDCMKDF